LGVAPESLAPVAVVTATRRLPIPEAQVPTRQAIDRAIWLAHSSQHQPYLIRDGYFDDAKRQLVMQLRDGPVQDRARLFRRMHALLEDYRRARTGDLEAITARAQAVRRRRSNGEVPADRTWPCPLYPDDVLSELRDEIHAAFRAAR
jgi:hypothetical protein